MCLRGTPIDGKQPSPAELLLGRSIQDNLSRRVHLRSPSSEDVIEMLEHRQENQRHYHDRGCKPLPDLVSGQPVCIQDPVSLQWKPAIIKDKLDQALLSYTVTTYAGRVIRRNQRHIMEAPPSSIVDPLQVPKQADHTPIEHKEECKPQTVTRSGHLVKPPNRYGH